MKGILCLLALLIILSTVNAELEEKVIQTKVNLTIEKTGENGTVFNLKLQGPQNTYELNDIDGGMHEYDFFTIAELECETKNIENLTIEFIDYCKKEYDKDCVDDEGMTYKERWNGCRINFEAYQSLCVNQTDFEKKYNECNSDLNNKVTAMSVLSTEKEQAKSNNWLYGGLGIAACLVFLHFKNKKQEPEEGPREHATTPPE